MIKKTILAVILVLNSQNLALAQDKEIADIFANAGIQGTLIIQSLQGGKEYIHNPKRAEMVMLPASTFKIPNTLFALEEGIVDEHSVLKWDGTKRAWKPWNQDQTLQSAFKVSCVWCYQEFARQIGNKKYLQYLQTLNYGNQKTGPNIDTFWLDGELKISARQQIELLQKLYHNNLPFSKTNLRLLKNIMVVNQTPDYIMRAKTGWAARIKPQHGWYVGYIENGADVWFFANNIKINTRSDLQYRQKIVRDVLEAKGIIN